MIPLFWVTASYAFCRVLDADTIQQLVAYGLLLCLSGAALAFSDDLISD